ncbi:hypothetical protein [Noviherbaspirillum aerium]|uniref:hypothetical protein n=1 Tax=Noviherbaspirillum aerium TaxID=2588497 RepID=UPI00178C7A7E|nr:hypothetical protein [Noviherbaspirillum aerium]
MKKGDEKDTLVGFNHDICYQWMSGGQDGPIRWHDQRQQEKKRKSVPLACSGNAIDTEE